MAANTPAAPQARARSFSMELADALPTFARLGDADTITLCMADTVACAMGAEALADTPGMTEGTIARIRRVANGGPGAATIWAYGSSATRDDAALRNTVAARYLDYNDTYVARAVIHPSDMIAPLVALAEERRAEWPRLIEAVGIAYEVMCRFADKADLRKQGFDGGASLTPIGAAAGAAWLLQLDTERTARALRIAALDAGMLRAVRQGRLSDWKAIAAGYGAVKGMQAARMADAGGIPPDQVFEGAEGFFDCVSGPVEIRTDDGSRMPRILLKKFPAQIFIQGLVELTLGLRHQVPSPSQIESITIGTFKQMIDMVGGHGANPAAMNRETADHSAAFGIAAVIVSGRLNHDDYDALLKHPDVLALMPKSISKRMRRPAAASRGTFRRR